MLSLFWGEFTLVVTRIEDLSDFRIAAFQRNLATLDETIAKQIREGQFFKYLGARPGKDFDSAFLNPDPDLIETAVLVDRYQKTVARSGRDLTDQERAAGLKTQGNILTDSSFLKSLIVTDFDGQGVAYLLLVVRPKKTAAEMALYASTLDFSRTVSLTPEAFGVEENRLLATLLAFQAKPREIFQLRGQRYVSVRRILFANQIMVYEFSPMPAVYTFFTPYVTLLCLFFMAVWILHGHSLSRRAKREASERILYNYDRAFAAQSHALAELSKLATENNVREKLVVGDQRQIEIEERIKEEREALKNATQPQQPIIIEQMPEERQFRFMNPARRVTASLEGRALDEKEQKLRERAFGDELHDLMDKMERPVTPLPKDSDNASILEKISAFEEKFRFPNVDQYLYYLNELYFDQVTDEELSEALRVAGDTLQAHDFAILPYDASIAAFRCAFVRGAAEELKHTLYLLPQDSVFPNDVEKYDYVAFDGALKSNLFFTKRFPAGFLDSIKGVHIFVLKESFLRGRILFFDKTRGGKIADVQSIDNVYTYIRQVAPAMHNYFTENQTDDLVEPIDLTEWLQREVRESLALSETESALWISQFVFEESLSGTRAESLVSQISTLLKRGEKVMLVSASRLVVVHNNLFRHSIEDAIAEVGMKYIVKESEFGKKSRNIYTFIEF